MSDAKRCPQKLKANFTNGNQIMRDQESNNDTSNVRKAEDKCRIIALCVAGFKKKKTDTRTSQPT